MNDVILNKISIIERCLKRIHEEYSGHEDEFETDQTKQDSIILNIQRLCEASIDLAVFLVRDKRLGLPQTSREAFVILEQNKIIDQALSQNLQKMVGFRNIAVHDYQTLSLDIIRSIIEHDLHHITDFTKVILKSQ